MQQRHKGGALLTALFIMTLVSIVATAMSMRIQLDIYRTRLIIAHDKLYLASQALSFWALDELSHKNKHFTKLLANGFVAIYPKNMEALDSQIKVTGGLYDLQSLFNINNLLEKKALPGFINLINAVSPQKTNQETSTFIRALRDWLSAYDITEGEAIYTSYYLKQIPPYYPGHQMMQSISELRLVMDVSAAIYLSLEPFLTALPATQTPVNINTASQPVLMSLGSGLTEQQANELIMARGTEGIKEFKNIVAILEKINVSKEQITIESNYFLSKARVSNEDFNLVVYTLLKRNQDKNGNLSASIVRQSFNTF